MSKIVIQVNGSSAGDGFLIAPDGGRIFSVPLKLNTNDGTTVNATIDVTPNKAGVTLPAGSVSIGPAISTIPIQAAAQSASRGDTVINVRVGGVTSSFKLTAIRNPEVWFRGRFEARFATDGDYYNNPRGTDGGTPGSDPGRGSGWTWALEGEPNFVPADNVPTTLDKPVGRVVRFNNPVAFRPFVAPVSTAVIQIQGATTTGTEVFTSGDPIIGAAANLGPNTALSAADQTGTSAGRNLNTRITHLQASTTLPAGWDGTEEYRGTVNAGITFQPVQSSVLDYLKGYSAFAFYAKLFTFHNDELCGYVRGSLTANTTSPAAPLSFAATPAEHIHPRLVRQGKHH